MNSFMKDANDAILRRVRLLRLQKRYSQEYMAARMSISQNAYSKMERGVTSVTLERIALIATILDTPVHDLVPPTDPPSKPGKKKNNN